MALLMDVLPTKTPIPVLKAIRLPAPDTVPPMVLPLAEFEKGKRDEAQAALASLLKRSKERFVPPFHIALLYNGLGEHDETLAWLERGYEQRDPKMTFLKVDPKWNNLRADQRFVNLMQRVGFAP